MHYENYAVKKKKIKWSGRKEVVEIAGAAGECVKPAGRLLMLKHPPMKNAQMKRHGFIFYLQKTVKRMKNCSAYRGIPFISTEL